VASTDWCSADGICGPDSVKIKAATSNMIHFLLNVLSYTPQNSSAVGENIGLSLSPNPGTNQLIIDNGELKIKEIEIYNTLGEKVYQSQISGLKSQISVDVSQLLSGIYFIKVRGDLPANRHGSQQRQTGKEERVAKFVKQ
jgi:hypothetical protein